MEESVVPVEQSRGARTVRRHRLADEAKAEAGITRTTINIPEDLWAEFAKRARSRGLSKSEATRRALWLYNLVDSRLAARCEFLVVWPDETEETIKLSPY